MYYSIPVSSVHGFSLELATAHCEQQEVRRDLAMRLRSYVHRGWAQTDCDRQVLRRYSALCRAEGATLRRIYLARVIHFQLSVISQSLEGGCGCEGREGSSA